MYRSWILAFVCGIMFVAANPVAAADLGTSPPAVPRIESSGEAVSYLNRYAVLLLIRSTFDVVRFPDVGAALNDEARRVSDGVTEVDEQKLDRKLLMEGGYYLVSLKYLTLSGGAAWPADKPESFYDNDALVHLDALEQRLEDSVADRTDPLDIFVEAQKILALSEGFATVPRQIDLFSDRDKLAAEAIRLYRPTPA